MGNSDHPVDECRQGFWRLSMNALAVGSQVLVVGAGAWGTTLAMIADRAGCAVTLVSRDESTVRAMKDRRRHPRSLPDIEIPASINVAGVNRLPGMQPTLTILAIPVQGLRLAVGKMPPELFGGVIVSAAKGIEVGSMQTPLGILGETLSSLDSDHFVALSGPNLAMEIARGYPATTVAACRSRTNALLVQHLLSSDTFRVYTSSDTVGVEMGGALKNIIAIGAGIADGLEAGQNAKAAFMTRGIAEIARLGVACGADPMTFAGLSGIGDLIATCGSTLSRNHTLGRELAAGRTLESIVANMSETAEGVETTRAAYHLAHRLGIDAPIIRGMYGVLFEGASPIAAAADLMTRDRTSE